MSYVQYKMKKKTNYWKAATMFFLILFLVLSVGGLKQKYGYVEYNDVKVPNEMFNELLGATNEKHIQICDIETLRCFNLIRIVP